MALSFATLLSAQTPPSPDTSSVLIVLRDQPAHQIAAAHLSPAASAQRLAEQDLRSARQPAPGQQLLSSLAALSKEVTEEIRAAVAPGQDVVAARLGGLGATGLRRFTFLNMLEAQLTPFALETVKQWAEVAEVIPVGAHQPLLDAIEQSAANPDNFNIPSLEDNDDAFLRLIDRVVDDRDLLVQAGSGVAAMNTLPAAPYSAASLSAIGTFSHLPVRAVQLNGPDSDFQRDSVSSDQPFRFYAGTSQGPLQSTLVWDRHFDNGLEPSMHKLTLSVFDSNDGSQLAAAEAPDQTVQQAAVTDPGSLVLKVRMDQSTDAKAAAEPFALSFSQTAFRPAHGPTLRVTCAAECTVSNDGDLPAINVVGSARGVDFPLGTIQPSATASFSPSPATDRATVTSKSFGEILTATAGQDPCMASWIVAPSSLTLNKANQWVGTVSVTPPAGCGAPWIAWPGPGPMNQIFGILTSGFTTGPGPLTIQGESNPPLATMSGTIYIARAELATPFATLAVTNIGDTRTPCNYSAAATGDLNASYPGGTVTVSITAPSGCDSVVSDDSQVWLVSASALGGTANWSAAFNITPNVQPNQSTTQRTANLIAASTTDASFTSHFTVQQSGLSCTFTPGALSLPPGGVAQSEHKILTLKTNNDCQWTAVSNSSFVHFVKPANTVYTSSGGAEYWVDPNDTGAKRPALVQIGGQTVSGDQDAQPKTPELTITEPASGETFTAGNRVTVQWKNGQTGTSGDIILVDRDGKQLTIATGVDLYTKTQADPWVIAFPGTATGTGFVVKIVSGGKTLATSGSFSIVAALSASKPVAGDVILLTKNGKPNSLTVTWQYNGPAGITGQFDLIDPNGKVYTLTANQALQSTNMSLVKPFPAGVIPDPGYTIRITPSDKTAAVTSGAFEIASELAIAEPARNPSWTAGSTYRIRVTGDGLDVNVYILDKKGTGQKIPLKSAETIPAGGLNIDWTVPATLVPGDYLVHADEVSHSNGQTATAPFTIISQQFAVDGRVTIPSGTQFATLAGCTVTIQKRHADGSLETIVVVPCDKGTWSAQLDRADSSGTEITYVATVARQDYTFETTAQQFKASDVKPKGYEFKVVVEKATVTAVGSNGMPVPYTTLNFLEKSSPANVGDPAILDPDINNTNNQWTGTVPKGAVRVTATAPGDHSLVTKDFALAPILTAGVQFVGSGFSATGSIQIGAQVPNNLQAGAWGAVQSVTITFTRNGQPYANTVATKIDAKRNEVRYTAYGFSTDAAYRAQAKVSAAYPDFTIKPPSNNQAIEPKGGPVSPFPVTQSQ